MKMKGMSILESAEHLKRTIRSVDSKHSVFKFGTVRGELRREEAELIKKEIERALENSETPRWSWLAKQLDRTPARIRNWAINIGNAELKKGPWTLEEDEVLLSAVARLKDNGEDVVWVNVAGVVAGRSQMQCRQRWNKLVGRAGEMIWTKELDGKLLEFVKNGDVSNREIAGQLGVTVASIWVRLKKLTGKTRAVMLEQQAETEVLTLMRH
ncbi:hypothetical protein HK097_003570 [Rhizophlyctis rosea]|uniref:Uncharacterized protein n=1 Tax=Rhizophlyctis rosea TaxID=64517 RepID=A0AAD5X666_9FUNG|nr:hypothetical protein HK097_003570 [Rhizophlyctis rosea]